MKLRFVLLLAAIISFAACETPYRATDSGVVVSPQTQSDFETQYPGATRVVWSSYDPLVLSPVDMELAGWPMLDSTAYVVTFELDNNNYYAWYDAKGNWIGSSYAITDYTTLPSYVTATLNEHYPGYNITNVNREFQKDRMAYEIELIKGDTKAKLLVDANNGTIIKQKEKMISH